MSPFGPAFGAALALAVAWSPADAALQLCNRSSYIIYAATGAFSAGEVAMQGWTRIAPGRCAVAITTDLTAHAYYLFARSSRAHAGSPRAWNGQTNLCVKDKDFALSLPAGGRCTAPETYELPFAALDTHHRRSWTATFRETPDLGSMQNAERAGLKRLLADIGTRDTGNPKTVDAALADLRRRLHVPAGADASALFDALETQAMKSAIPAGYTICNDTDKPAWAALGQKKGTVFVSRGWWTVAAGTCAQAITEPLANNPVYLRVERPNGAPLVVGPEKFCVTNIEFEIQGRERCTQRGLVEAGFAQTNAGGAPGFTAHVTVRGLAPG